jgi:hypothetical protein
MALPVYCELNKRRLNATSGVAVGLPVRSNVFPADKLVYNIKKRMVADALVFIVRIYFSLLWNTMTKVDRVAN